MLTFKVNAIGTTKTFVLLESQYLFVFACLLAISLCDHWCDESAKIVEQLFWRVYKGVLKFSYLRQKYGTEPTN
jgi:hypothetical protein